MSDYMELGESGLVPMTNGWFYNKETKTYLGPDGNFYEKVVEINEKDED